MADILSPWNCHKRGLLDEYFLRGACYYLPTARDVETGGGVEFLTCTTIFEKHGVKTKFGRQECYIR